MTRPGAGVAVALALVLGAGGALAACGDDSTGSTSSSTTSLPGGSATTTTSVEAGSLDGVSVGLQEIATVEQATSIAARTGDDALYVTSRVGEVRRIAVTVKSDGTKTYKLENTPVLDISDSVETGGGEQGLLSVVFSPDGRQMYVGYTAAGGDSQQVDEYTMNGSTVTKSSRRPIITVPDFAANHNGTALVFGPDGFLYYSMGDGGGAGDPQDSGQNPDDFLGSLLRIDPDGASGDDAYGVPNGNPFVNGGGAPEVFAYGLRNPWRYSFDRETGDLWLADVGQGEWEEVNFVAADDGGGRGANFGWSEMEGTHPYEGGSPPDGAVAPIYEYSHETGGCAVTGGYVYRGKEIPSLEGVYVFGDFCIGDILGLVHDGTRVTGVNGLGPNVGSLSSFGQDNDGELFAVSLDGPIYKIVAG